MTDRHDRLKELLKHLAAEFLNRESNRASLITVTDVDLAKNLHNAIILISVFPEEKAKGALDFVQRRRGELQKYIKAHGKLRRIPHFEFAIDYGEQNRQRIDKLLSK